MQGTMPGARRRGRPRTAWIDNIKMWTGLSVEESTRMTEDRDKWRKYVHGVANPLIEDGSRTGTGTGYPSVCLSRPAGYIDRLLYGTQQRGVRWTNAGSATLSAYAVAERRLDIL